MEANDVCVLDIAKDSNRSGWGWSFFLSRELATSELSNFRVFDLIFR